MFWEHFENIIFYHILEEIFFLNMHPAFWKKILIPNLDGFLMDAVSGYVCIQCTILSTFTKSFLENSQYFKALTYIEKITFI